MPSLISGYEYDIFISYRQKDNKGEKWVSEFVEALKTELESTFKEEISVYFDINPSDYLLESYDVGESLKDKLKCLVFLPIISRTYCDPKSFAWEHEFKVFAEQASKDQFGLRVKLPNGNVASRILPVRIHDLDASDIKECESVLGGVLRGIDFIYRETGIDKPLTPGDDEKENLNKTKYRIQLIKVAHAIKEIILGMKKEPVEVISERGQAKELLKEINEPKGRIENEKSELSEKLKLISTIAVIVLIIMAGIVTFPKIFKKNTIDILRSSGERISVAVMPFQNLTNDTINWNDYQYIIQTSLTSYLSNFPEHLLVRQTESIRDLLISNGITNYASFTPSLAGKISQKLDADVFIYGNIIKSGNVIRLMAQLIDSKTEEIIKSFQIEGPSGEVNFLPEIDTLSGFIKDYLVISELKKGMGKEQTSDDFFQVTTNSPDAYRYYIYGSNAPDFQTMIEWFKKSVSVDSSFTLPYTTATWQYIRAGKNGNLAAYDSAKKWCLEIYGRKDQAPPMQQLLIKSQYAFLFQSSSDQIKYLQQILNNDDQQPITYYLLGENYRDMGELEKAISALNTGLGIYEKWGIKPSWLYMFYGALLQSYFRTGRHEEGKKLIQKYQKDYPDVNLNSPRAILSFMAGDTASGNRYVEEWLSIQKKNSVSEVSIISGQLNIYSWGHMPEKVREYCHKILQVKSVNEVTLNANAWIMLFDDRNANEALELAERALSLSPENYTSLHRKGWALYQLGRYREALEFMQKSWDIRLNTAAPYNHEMYLHLEAVKKAVANQK